MSKISTPLGITIIIILAVIVGGGVLAYQYWWLPKQEKPIEESPSIKVLSPNGRETWDIGSMQTIRWSGNNLGPSYELGSGECTGDSTTINKCFEWAHRIKAVNLKSSSGQVTPLIIGERADVGSLNITVPSVTLGLYTVEIIAYSEYGYNVSDTSDAAFSIVAAGTPSITVLSPNGGEEFKVGDTIPIRWSYANGVWVDGYIYRTSGGPIYQFCEFGSCVDIQKDPFNGSALAGQVTISLSLKNFTAANDYRINLNLSSEGDKKVAEDDSDAPFSITK